MCNGFSVSTDMYELASVLAVVMVVRSGLRNPERSVMERQIDGYSNEERGVSIMGSGLGLTADGACATTVAMLEAVLSDVWTDNLAAAASWGALWGRVDGVLSLGGANRRAPVDNPRAGYGE
jgi:hypothetical protein